MTGDLLSNTRWARSTRALSQMSHSTRQSARGEHGLMPAQCSLSWKHEKVLTALGHLVATDHSIPTSRIDLPQHSDLRSPCLKHPINQASLPCSIISGRGFIFVMCVLRSYYVLRSIDVVFIRMHSLSLTYVLHIQNANCHREELH